MQPVVDELTGLNENVCYTLRHADDTSILISQKFLNTVPKLYQEALSKVQQWHERGHLSTNPQKTVIVPFTRERDLSGLKELTLPGHKLQLTTEVRYLGLILNRGLTQKAYRAFWTCKNTRV